MDQNQTPIKGYATELANAIREAKSYAAILNQRISIERVGYQILALSTGPRNPIAIVQRDGSVQTTETRWTRLVDERKGLVAERKACGAAVSDEYNPFEDTYTVSIEAEAALRRGEQIDQLVAAIDARLRGNLIQGATAREFAKWDGMPVDEWLSHRGEIIGQTEDEVWASCWPDLRPDSYCLSEDCAACLDADQRQAAGQWLTENAGFCDGDYSAERVA